MSTLKHSENPRQKDCLVVAVETIELAGKIVPISFAAQTVVNRRITTSLFFPIAWDHPDSAVANPPTREELQSALASAKTLRRLSVADLSEGMSPDKVFKIVAGVLRIMARNHSVLVIHGVQPGLEALLTSMESCLGESLPALSVVDTAVLERGRRAGKRPRPGESPGAYYRRMLALDGDLPDLQTCRLEQEFVLETILPTDRLFPVMSTYLIYQHYLGIRVRKPPGAGRRTR